MIPFGIEKVYLVIPTLTLTLTLTLTPNPNPDPNPNPNANPNPNPNLNPNPNPNPNPTDEVFVYLVNPESASGLTVKPGWPAPTDTSMMACLKAQQEFPDISIELVDLDSLMSKSDVVTLHCLSSDPGYKGLIDLDALAQMKRTALFINAAGGGGVVDETSLYAALKDEAIIFDCFYF